MRRKFIHTGSAALLLLATAVGACSKEKAGDGAAASKGSAAATGGSARPEASGAPDVGGEVNPRLLRRFQPIAERFEAAGVASATDAQVALGRMLYHDPRLSQSGTMSCNSCHDLAHFGVDGSATSVGFKGQHGSRNAPTVYNAAGAFVQFWDGRSPSVEEQAKGPILNGVEMAMASPAAVVGVLKGVKGYAALFQAAFPGDAQPITYDHVGLAIGAFERRLATPARWDTYLRGDTKALSAQEKKGLRTFLNVGCMVCHTGPLLAGSMFERVGVVEPWPNQEDVGRMSVTKQPGDRMMFKVPTLRNIEKTAPYFHDGSATTLPDAVRMMGKHQLGLDLSAEEVTAITAWLHSLTGTPPADMIAVPALPDGASLRADLPVAFAASAAPAAAPTGEAPAKPAAHSFPLQTWMEGNLAPAMKNGDGPALVRAFTRLQAFAPPGYDGWRDIAQRGLADAKKGDVD
ncbi:MAG: c-type cytochrome, partial [Polyangiaceae bacterium]|nr:c-type cytochrome [Polyangiaceae bacterium]